MVINRPRYLVGWSPTRITRRENVQICLLKISRSFVGASCLSGNGVSTGAGSGGGVTKHRVGIEIQIEFRKRIRNGTVAGSPGILPANVLFAQVTAWTESQPAFDANKTKLSERASCSFGVLCLTSICLPLFAPNPSSASGLTVRLFSQFSNKI